MKRSERTSFLHRCSKEEWERLQAGEVTAEELIERHLNIEDDNCDVTDLGETSTREGPRPPVRLQTNEQGYETLQARAADGDGVRVVVHHRLLFVAANGLDALDADEHVHHKSRVEWDNRPDNLQAVDERDHFHHHVVKRESGEVQEGVAE